MSSGRCVAGGECGRGGRGTGGGDREGNDVAPGHGGGVVVQTAELNFKLRVVGAGGEDHQRAGCAAQPGQGDYTGWGRAGLEGGEQWERKRGEQECKAHARFDATADGAQREWPEIARAAGPLLRRPHLTCMSATVPSPIHLFSPLKQRSIMLPNRIAVSPMCQYSSVDGFASDWHLVHLGSRAIGGAGVVFTEAAAVSPEGRITPGDLGIYRDEHISQLARSAEFIRAHGSVPGIQLAHAGRKASMTPPWEKARNVPPSEGGWDNVVAPSATRYAPYYAQPHELDRAGMDKVVADFAAAAQRAAKAGFLLAEVHAAHGYLAHEFLSPLSNLRTDEYGGSLENRARFPLEIIRSVRAAFPEHLPVWVRVSATDWVTAEGDLPGGLTLEETVEFARMVQAEGVDLLDVSSGGNDPRQQIPAGPGYQVHFAERIRQETGLATGAVGFITSAAQADQVLRTGQADVVLLARELLRDPYWPIHAADALGHAASWPVQYERAALGKVERRQPLATPVVAD
jgi:2,4-dienoyl-CoA reductase-like NADH-dependent reductase (Old Yellow Enzyme family)